MTASSPMPLPETSSKTETTAFTPGPWTVVAPDGFPYQIMKPFTQISDTVAQVYESAANARLIAAAPDLYEAADTAPILSKYHGAHGFEVERFIADYEAWGEKRRAALSRARTGAVS